MAQAEIKHEAECAADLLLETYEDYYERGWTDGLPIIPPTQAAAQRFIAASGRDADDLICAFPPRKGQVTVEIIAINAIMAGCRPEYMPVIVAAVEAMSDRNFPLEFLQISSNPSTPFVLVNGPIRKRLDINSGAGCLGPGWRANATIGRAIRLLLINAGGALPGVYSKCAFSSPLRYTFLCGENEEESPWTPFHVDRGFQRGDSTVTVFKALTYGNISGGEGIGVEETLKQIASIMPPMYSSRHGLVLLLGVSHAELLHGAGLSKQDIQQRLWELARVPATNFAQSFAAKERASGRGDVDSVWRTSQPDEIFIAVAGGTGYQDVYIAAESPQTRLVAGI